MGRFILTTLFAGLITQPSLSNNLNDSGPRFDPSRLSPDAIRVFQQAWKLAGAGANDFEEVVLVERRANGSLHTRLAIVDDDRREASFLWSPRIIAVFHTHPNAAQPKPTRVDRAVAEKFQVPIFTLTSRGLWKYDPATRRTSRVIRGLDWLDSEAWSSLRIEAKTTN